MSFLGKEYTYQGHEDFDTFLTMIGTPEDKVESACSFITAQKIEQDGDSYTLQMIFPGGTQETTFTPGEEIDDVIGPDQTPIKTTFEVEDNTVTQTITTDKGTLVMKREYDDDNLTVTVTAEGWDGVAKRFYKA